MYVNSPNTVTELKQEEIDKAISTILDSGITTLEEFIVAANYALAPYTNLGNSKKFDYNNFKIAEDYFPSTSQTNEMVSCLDLDYKVVFKYIEFFEKELNNLFSSHSPKIKSIEQLIQFLKDKISLISLELYNSGDVEVIKETFSSYGGFDFSVDPITETQRTTAVISGGVAHLSTSATSTILCTYKSATVDASLEDVLETGKIAYFGIGKKYGTSSTTAGTDAKNDQNVNAISDENLDSVFEIELVLNDLSTEALNKIIVNNYDILTNVGTSLDYTAINPNPVFDFEYGSYYSTKFKKATDSLSSINQNGVNFILNLSVPVGNYSKIIITPTVFENSPVILKEVLTVNDAEINTEAHSFISKSNKIILDTKRVIPVMGTNINKISLMFNQNQAYPIRYDLSRKLLISKGETQTVKNYLTDK